MKGLTVIAVRFTASVAVLAALVTGASAQEPFPSRPITLVAPFPPAASPISPHAR